MLLPGGQDMEEEGGARKALKQLCAAGQNVGLQEAPLHGPAASPCFSKAPHLTSLGPAECSCVIV